MLPVTGTLPTTEATLYTVISSRGSTIELVRCVNGGAGQSVVQLWTTVRGLKAALTPPTPTDIGTLLDAVSDSPVLRLDKGATISGVATLTGVTFLISGVEL